jgi:hypothetical protein
MKLFKWDSPLNIWARVRALGPPDWALVKDRLLENDEQIAAGNGWFVASPWSRDAIDQPATVFLARSGLHIAVRDDVGILGPELISISPSDVEKAGVAETDYGGYRLVVIYTDQGTIKGVAIDFARADKELADALAKWATEASIGRTVREIGSTETRLEGFNANPIGWDELRLRWAEKLDSLEKSSPLTLPYGSVIPMVFLGLIGDADKRLSVIRWLINIHPDEVPLDLAHAQCRSIDAQFIHEARALGLRRIRLKKMESQLLATDEALYYVTPGINYMHIRWLWPEATVRIKRRGRILTTVVVTSAGTRNVVKLGSRAAANIVTIADWAAHR